MCYCGASIFEVPENLDLVSIGLLHHIIKDKYVYKFSDAVATIYRIMHRNTDFEYIDKCLKFINEIGILEKLYLWNKQDRNMEVYHQTGNMSSIPFPEINVKKDETNNTASKKSNRQWHLYLVSNVKGSYKIGKSRNVQSRLSQLNLSSDEPLTIYKSYTNYGELEAYFHDYFKEKRCNTEWFKLDENDLEYIDNYIKSSQL